MTKTLLVLLAALVLPAAAAAKGIDGVSVCGTSGCKTTRVTGLGYGDPMFVGVREGPALPGRFFRVDLLMHGDAVGWHGFYEPVSGLLGGVDGSGWMFWTRPRPELETLIEDLASRVRPFPEPTLTEVRIGRAVVREEPSSYLRLFAVDGRPELPDAGGGLTIRMDSELANPWSETLVVYWPDDDVLQISGSRLIRVPDDVAAAIEAARPLGDGGGFRVPWVVIGIVIAFGAALLLMPRVSLGRGFGREVPAP